LFITRPFKIEESSGETYFNEVKGFRVHKVRDKFKGFKNINFGDKDTTSKLTVMSCSSR
jgi:hypothetical protein